MTDATQTISDTQLRLKALLALKKGFPDFPAFESDRDELLPPREPELF